MLSRLETAIPKREIHVPADLKGAKKLLKWMPGGNKIENYFMKYQSAQGHLNAILETLYRSQDELRKDNAAIEQGKVNLWTLMERLEKYIHIGKKLDGARFLTLQRTSDGRLAIPGAFRQPEAN